MRFPPSFRATFVSLALSIAACSGDKSAPEVARAATIEAVTPTASTAAVGTDLPVPPTVLVRDQHRRPMAGVAVAFTALDGGSVQQAEATTGADGTASAVRWTLGTRSGVQSLVARAGQLPEVLFGATALPGPAARLAPAWGGVADATVGDPVTPPPTVFVLDRYDNPVPGVALEYTVVAGGGSVATPRATSSATGAATPGDWRTGTTPGSNVLSVAVPLLPDLAPATFTASARPGPPASIVADAVVDSVGTVATSASAAPAVVVRDRYGNAAEGQLVYFRPTDGSGTVQETVVYADAAGRATAGTWTLGTRAGMQALNASSGGVWVTFTVRAAPGPPAGVAPATGDGQRGHVSVALPVALAARVTDAYGNGVAGVDVAAVIGDGGGSLASGGGATDADGIASFGAWTLGPAFGRNTVVATASGVAAPATFSAIGGGGEPARATVLDGGGQTGPVATALPVDPKVRWLDADGVPVNEYAVEFRAAGGATVRATTDVDGVASAPWTLGTVAGLQQLNAVAGTVTATLTATAVPGPPGRTVQLSGADQIQVVGTTLAVAPSVRVSDRYGNVRAGDVVTFEVTSGGGSVAGATVTADVNGVAQLGSWTLGASEGINGVTPVIDGFRGAEMVAKAVPPSSFDITLRYLSGSGSEYAAAFERAAERWRKVVIGDMPDFTATNRRFCGSSATDPTYPVLNETIDDVLIFVRIEKIDGPGKVLGQAGACALRAPPEGGYGSGIPIVGTMRLDVDDLQSLLASGRLDDVILHEMGHVLGIGSLWSFDPFFNLAIGVGGFDPYFVGPSGRAGFASAGGDAYGGIPVPIENQGAQGTRDVHWREAQLDVELMTGFVEPSDIRMPLSLTTIGSLEDMGYLVTAYGDDRYRFGQVLQRAGVRALGRPQSPIELAELSPPVPIALDDQGHERPLAEVRFSRPAVRRVVERVRARRER